MYVEADDKAILHVCQVNFVIRIGNYSKLLLGGVQRVGDFQTCDEGRRGLSFLQYCLRVKVRYTINGTDVEVAFAGYCHTVSTKISYGQIVISIVVVKDGVMQQTTDTFVCTYPNVTLLIFANGLDMRIVQSVFTLIDDVGCI